MSFSAMLITAFGDDADIVTGKLRCRLEKLSAKYWLTVGKYVVEVEIMANDLAQS